VGESYYKPRRAPVPLYVGTYMVTRDPGSIHEVGGVVPATPRDRARDLPTTHQTDILLSRVSAEIVSDNGRQFTAQQTRQFLETFGVRHQTAPTYAPHCNPVECINKTIKTMIAQYIGRNHRQ